MSSVLSSAVSGAERCALCSEEPDTYGPTPVAYPEHVTCCSDLCPANQLWLSVAQWNALQTMIEDAKREAAEAACVPLVEALERSSRALGTVGFIAGQEVSTLSNKQGEALPACQAIHRRAANGHMDNELALEAHRARLARGEKKQP